jgi:hypothetical protein
VEYLRIKASGEKIEIIDKKLTMVTTNSVNYFECIFDFNSIWTTPSTNQLQKTAVFYINEDEIYPMVVLNNKCKIPSEVLLDKKRLYIGLMGTREDPYTVLKTNWEFIDLTNGAGDPNSFPTPPTPDIYTQLINEFNEKLTLTTEQADRAEAEADRAQSISDSINSNLENYLEKDGDGKDVTVSFEESVSRENISTTEKLSILFGKIKKYLTDLKNVAFSGSYNDLENKPKINNIELSGSKTLSDLDLYNRIEVTNKDTAVLISANQYTNTHNVSNTAHSNLFDDVLLITEANSLVKNIGLNNSNGVFTITKYDNSSFTIDTKLEKIVTSFAYQHSTQDLVFTLDDGTVIRVSLSELVDTYTSGNTNTISININNHVITASIRSESIGMGLLTLDLQALINSKLDTTQVNTIVNNSKKITDTVTSKVYTMSIEDGVITANEVI